MWGEELFFDATKVEANASMESRIPRFAAEAHLGGLFGDEGAAETEAGDETSGPSAESELDALPAASDRGLRAKNAERDDWISKDGKPDRTIVRDGYRRRSDYELSPTDPDASLMQHKRGASRAWATTPTTWSTGEGPRDPERAGHPGGRHGEPAHARPPL